MPEIEFIVEDDGSVTMDGKNFSGKGCHEAMAAYVKAIGRKKTEKKKAEFYQKKQSISQKAKLGGA